MFLRWSIFQHLPQPCVWWVVHRGTNWNRFLSSPVCNQRRGCTTTRLKVWVFITGLIYPFNLQVTTQSHRREELVEFNQLTIKWVTRNRHGTSSSSRHVELRRLSSMLCLTKSTPRCGRPACWPSSSPSDISCQSLGESRGNYENHRRCKWWRHLTVHQCLCVARWSYMIKMCVISTKHARLTLFTCERKRERESVLLTTSHTCWGDTCWGCCAVKPPAKRAKAEAYDDDDRHNRSVWKKSVIGLRNNTNTAHRWLQPRLVKWLE